MENESNYNLILVTCCDWVSCNIISDRVRSWLVLYNRSLYPLPINVTKVAKATTIKITKKAVTSSPIPSIKLMFFAWIVAVLEWKQYEIYSGKGCYIFVTAKVKNTRILKGTRKRNKTRQKYDLDYFKTFSIDKSKTCISFRNTTNWSRRHHQTNKLCCHYK